MSSSTARAIFLTITIAGLSAPMLAQTAEQRLLPVPQVAGVPTAAQQAAEQIDPERIRASVKYLADDKLEGRGPGTEGDRLRAITVRGTRRYRYTRCAPCRIRRLSNWCRKPESR